METVSLLYLHLVQHADSHVAYFIVFRKPFQGEVFIVPVMKRSYNQLSITPRACYTAYLVMYKYFSSQRDLYGVSLLHLASDGLYETS